MLGPPPPTLYAPLSFLVGSVGIEQFPTFQWNGNLNSVTESGTEYGAVSVARADRRRDGVRLIVRTSDPSGRKLIVDVGPGPERGTIAVSARPDDPSGVAAIGDSFRSPDGEAFRGFGGRHDSLDQAGSEFYNWTQQENLSAPGLGGPAPPGVDPDTYLFPNGEHAAYYVQSSFVSPDRYGFLLDRDELSDWRLGSDRSGAWQVQSASSRLDYVVAPGSSRAAIRKLTAITGRHRVPPRWALGPALDRLVEFPSQPADDYAAAVRDDLRQLRATDTAIDSYRIEGWQFLPRPFLRKVIAKLHHRGIRPLVYFRSFVGEDEIGTDDPDAFDEAIDRGYVATEADGDPYVFDSNFSAPAAQIDFTDPAAVRWWKGRVRRRSRLGAEGFMQDFGEQVQVGMHFDDGSTGATMHNRLPVLFHRATFEVVRAFERRHPGRHIYWFTRNGYSGTPGSAHYEMSNFPGDETTDWSRSAGLASLTTDMLNRAIGGAWGFTTDIGGFYDVPYGATDKELFLRWAEWAALSPFFRIHGSVDAGTHTPWSYDDADAPRLQAAGATPPPRRAADHAALAGRASHRDAGHPPALARVPVRPTRRRTGPGVAARTRPSGRARRRGGRDVPARLLPARLLARSRRDALPGPGRSRGRGAARAAALVRPLRDRPARLISPGRRPQTRPRGRPGRGRCGEGSAPGSGPTPRSARARSSARRSRARRGLPPRGRPSLRSAHRVAARESCPSRQARRGAGVLPQWSVRIFVSWDPDSTAEAGVSPSGGGAEEAGHDAGPGIELGVGAGDHRLPAPGRVPGTERKVGHLRGELPELLLGQRRIALGGMTPCERERDGESDPVEIVEDVAALAQSFAGTRLDAEVVCRLRVDAATEFQFSHLSPLPRRVPAGARRRP